MKKFAAISLVVAAAIAAGVWFTGRRSTNTQAIGAGGLRGRNVLLVTIDTLRADRVGAYGSPLGATPALDRLAREGLRFEHAYAHVPLTLPSHATILTGLYPFTNGVRDNGTFRLAGKPTLATALKAAGYRTAAFVGAFVLDARFGLNAGFDLYDDRMQGTGSAFEVVERRADAVIEPALEWILARPSAEASAEAEPRAPWFAWVHLYDPHEPYDPPEPYRSRYASDPYLGEIAYADAALATFFDKLRSAGALDRTLVLVLSDHGESLGEHGERTHGLFAYEATLRVPLIIWSANDVRPAVVSTMMRLVDVTPTILDLVGAQTPAAVDGRSIRPFVAGERPFDAEPSYFEALNANFSRNWAPLKGILVDRLKLIDLPIPELYDLDADPGEAHNIYASAPDRARTLERALDRLPSASASAAPGAVDPDAAQRLRSLGYVVGTPARPSRTYTAADDPKRLVHLNNALDEAAALWSRGDAAGAVDTLRKVIEARPDLTIAYDRLAHMLQASGRVADAVALLDGAARAGHADAALLRSLGSMLRDAGDLPRSAAVLEPLVARDESDLQSMDALGQTYARMRRFGDAERLFKRVLDASPNAATTWNNLGTLYLAANRDTDAIAALSRATAIDPSLAAAHNGLGVAHARQGDVTRAVSEWREALRIRPDLNDARANLEKVGAR